MCNVDVEIETIQLNLLRARHFMVHVADKGEAYRHLGQSLSEIKHAIDNIQDVLQTPASIAVLVESGYDGFEEL
jgi:hypothetical protein